MDIGVAPLDAVLAIGAVADLRSIWRLQRVILAQDLAFRRHPPCCLARLTTVTWFGLRPIFWFTSHAGNDHAGLIEQGVGADARVEVAQVVFGGSARHD